MRSPIGSTKVVLACYFVFGLSLTFACIDMFIALRVTRLTKLMQQYMPTSSRRATRTLALRDCSWTRLPCILH